MQDISIQRRGYRGGYAQLLGCSFWGMVCICSSFVLGFRHGYASQDIREAKSGSFASLNHPSGEDLSLGTPAKTAPLRMTEMCCRNRQNADLAVRVPFHS